MTDVTTQRVAGWYPDPEHLAASRFWDGRHWTEHTRGQSAIQAAPPSWLQSSARLHVSNRPAKAALVAGLIATVANVLLIPTIVAVVCGVNGISRAATLRRAGMPGVGAMSSLIGVVLGIASIGLLAVQAAVAIPVYDAVTSAARAQALAADVETWSSNQGTKLGDVDCGHVPDSSPGTNALCTATDSKGTTVALRVTYTDPSGGFRVAVMPPPPGARKP